MCIVRYNSGAVAHLGERLHGMEEVASSILVSSTIFISHGCVAQLVEHSAHTRYVEGSNPPAATICLIQMDQ